MAVVAFSGGLNCGSLTAASINNSGNQTVAQLTSIVSARPNIIVQDSSDSPQIQFTDGTNSSYVGLARTAGQLLSDSGVADFCFACPTAKKSRFGLNGGASAIVTDGSLNATVGGALSMTSGTMSCGTNSATTGLLYVNGGGAAANFVKVSNSSGDSYFGIENGGGIISGSAAGDLAIRAPTGNSILFGNSTTKIGSLSSTGNLSINGALSMTSGTLSCGANAATVGALNSASIANSGTMNCTGAATFGSTITCGTNSATCGLLRATSVASNSGATNSQATLFSLSTSADTRYLIMGYGPGTTSFLSFAVGNALSGKYYLNFVAGVDPPLGIAGTPAVQIVNNSTGVVIWDSLNMKY